KRPALHASGGLWTLTANSSDRASRECLMFEMGRKLQRPAAAPGVVPRDLRSCGYGSLYPPHRRVRGGPQVAGARRGELGLGEVSPHLASAPLGPPVPRGSALAVAAELAVWGLL